MNRFLIRYIRLRQHKQPETMMQDILTFILASRTICRPAPVSTVLAEQRFYDTAAPHAGAVYALRRRVRAWTSGRNRNGSSGVRAI